MLKAYLQAFMLKKEKVLEGVNIFCGSSLSSSDISMYLMLLAYVLIFQYS
jgi:hypothetical protein